MAHPPFITADELSDLLPMERAVDALGRAFASDLPYAPRRSHLAVDEGDLLVMPAWGSEGVGIKLVTVAPNNPERGRPLIHGVYVLFSAQSLAPVALLDGSALTAIRTAAVSGVATRHLARRDATRLVIFGAGTQAHAHLDSMLAVRPLSSLAVVSRSESRARELARRGQQLGIDASAGEVEAVREADIVCTCTTSKEALFDGRLLPRGVHLNAIGAYKPDARELDDATMKRAKVFVEVKEPALHEAGDLKLPLEAGVIDASDVAELADVVRGEDGRADEDQVTVFKSVGVAFEDLVVARAVAEAAGIAG